MPGRSRKQFSHAAAAIIVRYRETKRLVISSKVVLWRHVSCTRVTGRRRARRAGAAQQNQGGS